MMLAGRKSSFTQEKYFRNLIKATRNQLVFTIYRLIWIQTDVRLDPNQSEDGVAQISGCFNKISEIFLCAVHKSSKLLLFDSVSVP